MQSGRTHPPDPASGGDLSDGLSGLTLTDAINVFFQQSLNAGGFPFAVTGDNAEIVKAKALARLVKELKKGDDCTESYSAEQARAMLGIAE